METYSDDILTSHTSLRILLIEDNPSDVAAMRDAVERADGGIRIYEAEALLAGLDRLADGDIDLVLLDLSVFDGQGLDGLHAIHTHAPGVPVVVLTGMDSDAIALRAVQSGARDYLAKDNLDSERLTRVVRRAAVKTGPPAENGRGGADAKLATIVGCLGSKGGVGTTTIACHLGTELKRLADGRVLLMDLDLCSNAVAFFMKVSPRHTILDASNNILHMNQSRWDDMIVRGGEGLEIIPSGGPAWLELQQPKIERLRCLLRFIRTFYQWIVIDLGRLSPFSARVAAECSQILLVSSLEAAALNECARAAHRLHESGNEPGSVRLAINKAPKTPALSEPEIEKLVDVPMEAMLPECDYDFKSGYSSSHVLGTSRAFEMHVARLAAKLAGVKTTNGADKGRFARFRRRG
ncbi:MAG: response regulator [Bryobacteraceae bacterium]